MKQVFGENKVKLDFIDMKKIANWFEEKEELDKIIISSSIEAEYEITKTFYHLLSIIGLVFTAFISFLVGLNNKVIDSVMKILNDATKDGLGNYNHYLLGKVDEFMSILTGRFIALLFVSIIIFLMVFIYLNIRHRRICLVRNIVTKSLDKK